MNEPEMNDNGTPLSPDELHAAMFAQMVMQLASTALVMMGRMPNPMTGKTETDLDAAQLFIGQLEMLEAKTRGNLSEDEQHLLKQNLMSVRMAFVQAVQSGKAEPAKPEAAKPPSVADTKPAEAGEDESKKKFTKSYGAS